MVKHPPAHPPAPEAPFSRPFLVEELLRKPDEPIRVEADAKERAALAELDDLPGVGALVGEFKVSRTGKMIHVRGEVRARVTQICVVTLEPFESEMAEPVDVRFAETAAPPPPPPPGKGPRMSRRRAAEASAPAQTQKSAPAISVDPDEDEPDPIVDGRIDLGALAAEFLALGLDPYPRKPGVAFAPPETDSADESPFAALRRLQGGSGGEG